MLLLAVCCGTWADTYKLVTSANELSQGDIILIAAAKEGTSTGNITIMGAPATNNCTAVSTTITGDVITELGDGQEIELESVNTSGYFTMKVGDDSYLYAANSASGKNNYLKTKLDNSVYWSISINASTNAATIKDQVSSCNSRNLLRYNSQSTLFSCYSSGQSDVYIFKKQVASNLDPSDFALANSPVSLNFDLYNNSAAQTISYTTSSTGAVSVAQSDYATFVVDQTNKTITVTPTAVTNGAQTITVSQAADETYAAGSVTFTVNVTDSRPSYSVTYKANGGVGEDIVRTYPEGTNVTIEGNTFTYAGHRFVKWNTEANGTGTDYQVDGSIENIHADVSLFAQWGEVYDMTYDFTQIDGFDDWNQSYTQRTVTYDDATVTFASANRQTSTITNQPVTKGGDVELVMTDGSTLATASFVCTQWTTKEQTITLHYSTDGGENYTSTGITSSNFTISSNNLPVGTNAVKITFSSSSNQIGIASATVLKVPEIEITNNNEIAYNGTTGSFNFSITNPAGGTMTVNEDVEWISNAAVSGNTVTFTTEANKSINQARTGVITLTYTYNGDKTVTEEVTVTQAAAPQTATITLNAACTDGEMVYGTYSNTSAFVVSDDIVVAEVGIVDGKLWVEEYETGAVVPANTGVMVSALEGGDYTVTLTDEDGTSVLGEDNNLRPTGAEGINATDMAAAEDVDCLYYRLTMHNGETIGFWWGAEDGAAFSVAANKAYLAVPANQAKDGFAFGNDGGATSISTIDNGQLTMENAYNLQGQKVGSEYKGIVIVNGKKFINK